MDGPTRFVQVTNDNSLVKYASNNSWMGVPKADLTFPFPYGNMGAPVSSFLQQFSGGLNGSISFTFEGIEITVMTSCYVLVNISEPHAVSCRVDNRSLVTNIPQFSQNNWPICNSGNLADGEHTLTINIASSGILFDYILFAPSPVKMLDLTDVSTRIEASDPSVTYSTQFVIQNNTGLTRFINDSEASVTIPFFGQQLTWYGAFLAPLPAESSPVQYSVDSGTPSEFVLEADIPFNFSDLLNQPLFQTEVLPQGHHQVTATYLGNGGIPLSLSFVVVQNFSNIAPSPTSKGTNSTMTDVPTTTPLKITSAGSRNDRDMIIGIAFGVGIFLLIIILFLFRRWKKRGLKVRKSEERFDISSNRERAMRTISTVMPNPFNVHDSGQSGDSLLTRHRRPAFATETSDGSIEVLFNSYAITPFQIPSLPVADFEEEKITHNNPRSLPLAVHDSHFPNDAADLSLNQHNRSLLNTFVPPPQLADSGSTRAAVEALGTSASAALFSRLISTARLERHVDSGVRLDRETLFYNETNSEWSLRSKDKLPPLYTHD